MGNLSSMIILLVDLGCHRLSVQVPLAEAKTVSVAMYKGKACIFNTQNGARKMLSLTEANRS